MTNLAYAITSPTNDNEIVVSENFDDELLGRLIKREMKKSRELSVRVSDDNPWNDK